MAKRAKRQLELPLDIIANEILTRLPVKTLSRFRCVSKQWCSLIMHPDFQKEHSHRSQKRPHLLVVQHETDSDVIRFSTYFNEGHSLLKEFFKSFANSECYAGRNLFIFQSHLGLVCLRTMFDGAIHICNPSTEEILTLPPRPMQIADICVGFGYTSTKEIKVVRYFPRSVYGEECCCEVLTLGTSDGWREARSHPPYKPNKYAHLVFLHGALHFLPDDVERGCYISAFAVDVEEYKKISLPESYFEEGFYSNRCELAELNGSLCMSVNFFYSMNTMELWLLKDYQLGRWVKEYNIDLSSEPLFPGALAITGDGCLLLNTRPSPEENHDLCCYSTKEGCFVRTIGAKCFGVFYTESFFALGTRQSPYGTTFGCTPGEWYGQYGASEEVASSISKGLNNSVVANNLRE